MRNRLYGGVRGRKMKVGGNYFIFLLLDLMISIIYNISECEAILYEIL
jgi:hypothetical protein